MFGVSTPELLIILGVALVILGPQKLPDLAKALGRAVGEFRKATSEIKETFEADENLASVKQTFEDAVAEGMRGDWGEEEEEEGPGSGGELPFEYGPNSQEHPEADLEELKETEETQETEASRSEESEPEQEAEGDGPEPAHGRAQESKD